MESAVLDARVLYPISLYDTLLPLTPMRCFRAPLPFDRLTLLVLRLHRPVEAKFDLFPDRRWRLFDRWVADAVVNRCAGRQCAVGGDRALATIRGGLSAREERRDEYDLHPCGSDSGCDAADPRRVQGVSEDGCLVGPSPPLPDLWSRRLLRLVAEQARHQALPRDAASTDPIVRTRRRLDLVLHRRGGDGA